MTEGGCCFRLKFSVIALLGDVLGLRYTFSGLHQRTFIFLMEIHTPKARIFLSTSNSRRTRIAYHISLKLNVFLQEAHRASIDRPNNIRKPTAPPLMRQSHGAVPVEFVQALVEKFRPSGSPILQLSMYMERSESHSPHSFFSLH